MKRIFFGLLLAAFFPASAMLELYWDGKPCDSECWYVDFESTRRTVAYEARRDGERWKTIVTKYVASGKFYSYVYHYDTKGGYSVGPANFYIVERAKKMITEYERAIKAKGIK